MMLDSSFGKTISLAVAINSPELKQNVNYSDNQPRDIQRVLHLPKLQLGSKFK